MKLWGNATARPLLSVSLAKICSRHTEKVRMPAKADFPAMSLYTPRLWNFLFFSLYFLKTFRRGLYRPGRNA
jgi:hypothetical protein